MALTNAFVIIGSHFIGRNIHITPETLYNISVEDYIIVSKDATANVNFYLPLASQSAGRLYYVKNSNTGTITVTVNASAGDNIEGSASIVLNANEYQYFVSDGVNNWIAF